MAVLRNVLAGLVLTVVLGGCTYVFPQQYEAHVACLDEDGDGFVRSSLCETLEQGQRADCDDARDDRAPDLDEQGDSQYWYDGVDNDCDGADVIDSDADGYPGILEENWTAQHDNLTYPSGLTQELDCDDTVAQTFPGSEFEEPYDGVDSDCVGDDDFDDDGDGHVPPADRLPPGAATYDGDLPEDDCDDSDDSVYPGTSEDDVWYDGEDTNCDGANDFDQDGDDYIPDEYISDYEAFLAFYDYDDDRACTGDDGSCDDCDDDPSDNDSQPVDASAVNPGATETWYDGVDQDFADDDDFDQDHDGYLCDGSVLTACSGNTGTDCVDDDSAINPASLELLGDSVDQDCDTVDDGAIFHYGGLQFDLPAGPRVEATSHHYLLGTVAELLDDGQARSNVGVVYTFDPSIADASGTITASRFFDGTTGSTTVQAPGLGLVGEADAFYVSHAHDLGGDVSRLLRYDHFSGLPGDYVNRPEAVVESDATVDVSAYNDFDLQVDADGRQWSVACSGTTVNLLVADNDGDALANVERLECDTSSTSERCPVTPIEGAIACYIDPETGDETADKATAHVHLFSDDIRGAHRAFVLDINTTTSSIDGTLAECTANDACDDWSDLVIADVNLRDRALAFAGRSRSDTSDDNDPRGVTLYDDSGLVGEFGTSYDVVTADAWKVDDNHWYVAVLVEDLNDDNLRDVVLLHDDPTSFDSAVLNITDPGYDIDPSGVSVFADADRLMVGITAEGPSDVDPDDVIGWAFLGFAP